MSLETDIRNLQITTKDFAFPLFHLLPAPTWGERRVRERGSLSPLSPDYASRIHWDLPPPSACAGQRNVIHSLPMCRRQFGEKEGTEGPGGLWFSQRPGRSATQGLPVVNWQRFGTFILQFMEWDRSFNPRAKRRSPLLSEKLQLQTETVDPIHSADTIQPSSLRHWARSSGGHKDVFKTVLVPSLK